MRSLPALFLGPLLAAGLSCSPSTTLPGVSDVTCSTTSIPCNDAGKTAILCKGSALGVTGTVTYTWQCFHGGIGIPVCTYVSASANQQCQNFEDEFQCTGPADATSVELHCTGLAREQCSLIVAVGGLVSDPRINQGRFVISLSPACPMPDGGASDGGGLDGGGSDGGASDAGP